MTDETIKCSNYSRCGEEIDSIPIRGFNNTKLCVKCRESICFICGKKETKKEWIEDVDCCGNKIRKEIEIKMFCQKEKQEDNPNEEIFVHYCDQHQQEAQNSPYLFTEAEMIARREQKRKEENEKLDQEKREREERLNNQKNLFFHEGRTDDNEEGEKYNVYLGRENGQDYYLMVPFNHPIWKSTDSTIKEIASIIKNEGNYLFLVDGIENIPIEKSPPRLLKIFK